MDLVTGLPASARVIRIGVLLSAAFLFAGLVDSIIAPDPLGNLAPSSIMALPAGVIALNTQALIHTGILLLLATPIARVIAVGIELALRRETPFVLICAGVLFLLALSVYIGSR
ncbi:MAG TPA: DUF1634 domain-containing protein [Thermoanaerobaculia bacterium]|nr:DUF1634 domain-containing protein [Thermoanaerobaculia bacterium]